MKKLHFLLIFMMYCFMACTKKDSNQISTLRISNNWTFKQVGTNEWMPASVPGCVHSDLLSNGKIEDPYYRLNEHDQQWIDKKEWEYQTTFTAGKDITERSNIELNFEGLDTYADAYLNDSLILSADNMFRTWEIDCKKLIRQGENLLRIVFHSPIAIGIEKYNENIDSIPVSGNDFAKIGQVEGEKKVSVYTRKAGYHFGWDWGPRFVTSGIWRPVTLSAWDDAILRDLEVKQNFLNDKTAQLTANIEIDASSDSESELSFFVNDSLFKTEQIIMKTGKNLFSSELNIMDPQRWWPNGHGKQNLYNIKVVLGNCSNNIISTRIGLRTVEVIQEPDSIGTSFYFKVNGVPMFMKGANYIPQDLFLDRVTDEKYEKLIQSCVDANMNMIRVWGGGIYENDIFYNLCDEKGILVWQDFMFACAMFPGDKAFLKNVEQEAIDNVKRLRNHPCIALWCGNNECLAAWKQWGWERRITDTQGKESAQRIWKAYKDIFLTILPQVVKNYDGDRLYWSSSPCAIGDAPANYTSGDNHYWQVWHGRKPFASFDEALPRFMSEFGFQSFPEFNTVKKYTIPEDWDIYSEVMKSHQRSKIGNEAIEEYMLRDYKKPEDFEMFLYVGQVLQAKIIDYGIHAHRRNRHRCMGSLYWQVNDCWPVASWAGMDYYGNWKALHYFVKKAFENIIVSPIIEGNNINVYIISDELTEQKGELTLQIMDFEGNELWSLNKSIAIAPNTSKVYYSVPVSELPENAISNYSVLIAQIAGNQKLLYFVPPKKLELPVPEIKSQVLKTKDGYTIKLSSNKLAKNVYLSSDKNIGFFSDNYFDLLPGEEITILLKTEKEITGVENELKIVSLIDTYNTKR